MQKVCKIVVVIVDTDLGLTHGFWKRGFVAIQAY